MHRKVLYLLLIASALIAAFAFGYFKASNADQGIRQAIYYVDPMHPGYRSAKPGIAPDCGMQLVPVYAEDLASSSSGAGKTASGQLRVSAALRQLYGIQLAPVQRTSSHNTIRVFGRVTADETRIFRVNLGTDGYVKETKNDAVGNRVAKDQHLAVVYSPEFLSVAGGYLSANERTIAGMPKDNSVATPNAASAQARADRLRNLGMSDAQITELSTTRKIPEDVYVVAPTDGIILSRNISPGLRFERHTDLYTVADLSHIWVSAEVFGDEAKFFRPGASARVFLPNGEESFPAHVSDALPEVDTVTHELKIRLEVDNLGYKLRPEMYVSVDLPTAFPPGLSIPQDAVVDSGTSKHVFVKIAQDIFESRRVETGWNMGDRIEVVKGLKEGEEIVSSGTFLIDSESKLRLTATNGKSGAFDARADIARDPQHTEAWP